MSIKEKAVTSGSDILSKISSPKVLTAGIVVGVVTTGVLSALATYRAMKAIEEEEDDRWRDADIRAKKEERILHNDYDEVFDQNYIPLTTMDKIKIGWPYYIPPFLVGAATVTDGIFLYKNMNKQMTAEVARLTAECAAKEAAHQVYREEVIKKIGEKKERDIEYEAHARELEEKVFPNISESTAIRCGVENGEQLFYDPHTGQDFVSTFEIVRRAIQDCIDDLHLNEFYDFQLLLSNMGAKDCNLTYRWAVQTAGMDHDAIDKNTCIEVHLGNHLGHEVSVAWLNIPIVDTEKL